MIRLLLKIWLAAIPVLLYLLWVLISTIIVAKIRNFALKIAGKGRKDTQKVKKTKKTDFVDADYVIIDEKSGKNSGFLSRISLSNKNFVISIYLGMILLVIILVSGVFLEEKNHKQSTIEDLQERVVVE